ncbi:19449_t:CDS:2, partial [Cetraspora pellucida]
MSEADEYFENFDANYWSYDGFQKFLTAKKFSETIWINSLKAISNDNNYPVRCRKKAKHFLNNYSSVIFVIPSKQSTAIFNLWKLDEEVNENLDNIFSILKSKETLNAENIFEELEQNQKL